MRFGDGDVNLMHGRDELLQKANPSLQVEMLEAFSLGGPGILKCLPLHSERFGIWPGMKPGLHSSNDQWAENILSRCSEFFIGEPIYSHVALAYVAVFDPAFALDFLRMLRERADLFIGNHDVPEKVLNTLFGDIPRVACPPSGAYVSADRVIEQAMACLGDGRHHSIVVAMGCSGRVVAKRLLNSGLDVFVFDFGSLLDALCGWDSRAWVRVAPRSVRYILDEL
jgi:hypothetical protein